MLGRCARRRPDRPADVGAVAVEFALVLPLLMLFLFGIIQFGYGLFQLQNFNSVLTSAARSATQGISSCPAFTSTVQNLAEGSGLPAGDISGLEVSWLDDLGGPSDRPVRLGRVRVTATLQTFNLGVPFIPFPQTITRTQTAIVSDVTDPALGPCP